MKKVYFVTGNDYKYKTARKRLTESEYNLPLGREEVEVTEIQSRSLEEIALNKVQKAYKALEKPVLVTDSGLFIKKYNGFPGPYTHYVQDTLGLEGLLKLVKKPTPARVEQTVAYKDKNHEKTFTSGKDGKLITEKKGENGFFFDYIFELENGKTLAELGDVEKSKAWGDRWDRFAKWYIEYQSDENTI